MKHLPPVQLTQAIAALLVTCGWTLSDGTAIASKMYPTAVGPKQALVYLVQYPESDRAVLTGDYTSEGRNALSTAFVFVPHHADPETIHRLVHQFATGCNATVADTYAVRLLKEPA